MGRKMEESRVGMGFSGAGIIGHYEPPDMGAGD